MRFNRRRSDRPDSARSRLGSCLETLEKRELLTSNNAHILSRGLLPRNPHDILAVYTPADLAVYNPITHQRSPYSVNHQLQANPGVNSPLFNNEGKVLSGKTFRGDEWTITVHGPGYAVVTVDDPNSGSLSGNIDTIQLVGTDIHKTYVTGNVVTTFRPDPNLPPDNSTIPFNRLIATSGVNSIILNGFDLQQTVTPAAGLANNANTGVFLYGGVQHLEFHDINTPIDTATTTSTGDVRLADLPINVVIGDPANPLPARVKPTIVLDSINNTVFSSTAVVPPALIPPTTPTVNIIVNGQIQTLSLTSATGAIGSVLIASGSDTTATGAPLFFFPTIPTTGRTSIQAIGINHVYVYGGATNFTASRTNPPFQNGFSGLDHLRSAQFNGPVDGVGLDVNGPIGTLAFNQGIGNTNGLFIGTNAAGNQIPASSYGAPADQTGYAGAGLISGQVTATRIRRLAINTANVTTQVPQNPDFVQINGIGTYAYTVRPGVAAANALIVSSGNIGKTHIVGDVVNSEIKSGFHYPSYAAGLEGTRARSQIAPVTMKGNLTNGVISATYRPFMNFYGSVNDTQGPGKIVGNVTGTASNTGALTPLGNVGGGVYARVRVGRLPQALTQQP